MNKGLIHIYCGDGKGKTTAAFGLAIRAAGRNKKVVISQFLKDYNTGELKSVEKLSDNIKVIFGKPITKFIWNMNEEEKNQLKEEETNYFGKIVQYTKENNVDVLILDEIIGTINNGTISLQTIMDFLKNKPESLEVIMTGRDPKEELINIADYISEVKMIKHPFEKGIGSREGIEY